jgi:hypothetical protein
MRWRGVGSLLLLVLAWLALDDITTDDSTGRFLPEYSLLVICGIWFTGLAGWLLARGRVLLGLGSLVAVALAVVAFWSLPHHYAPLSVLNYLGYVPIAWFLLLAIWLIAARSPARPKQRAEHAAV